MWSYIAPSLLQSLAVSRPFAAGARSPEPQKRRLGALPIVRGALALQRPPLPELAVTTARRGDDRERATAHGAATPTNERRHDRKPLRLT